MVSLRNVLTQIGMFDLRYSGPLMTWSNKSPTHPVAEKLDRLLVNYHWIARFPNSQAIFLPPNFSDHTPCILDTSVPLPIAGTRPFKFFNYLTKHPNFLTILENEWNQAGGIALNLSSLCYKLLLQAVQVEALTNPSEELFQQEQELHDKWCFLRQIEESFFKQKSRVNWLREGDLNTVYFHRLVRVRASFNSIRSFTLPSGDIISDPHAMGMHAVKHFQDLLSPDTLPFHATSRSWIQEIVSFRCPEDLSRSMTKSPSPEEITQVMRKLNANKAPGPDGYTSGFFKSAWQIIGTEVISSINQFFLSGFLPSATNSTILTLVPKRQGASAISDFRPVSCCNTLYKTISKLLVHRLKPMLPALILPNQTAFVQGRLLVENTVLAAEVVNGYHRNRGPKRITLKVDITKAFDTVSWDFIFTSLQAINVPDLYIRWLRACVCTPSFFL